MARIKFTGYMEVENLDPRQVDLEHSTGLSAEGYDDLVTGNSGQALTLADLDDVETEVVDR